MTLTPVYLIRACGDNQDEKAKHYPLKSIAEADTIEAEVPMVVVENGKKKEPSLWSAAFGGFGVYYFCAGLLKLLGDLVPFINSQVLGYACL